MREGEGLPHSGESGGPCRRGSAIPAHPPLTCGKDSGWKGLREYPVLSPGGHRASLSHFREEEEDKMLEAMIRRKGEAPPGSLVHLNLGRAARAEGQSGSSRDGMCKLLASLLMRGPCVARQASLEPAVLWPGLREWARGRAQWARNPVPGRLPKARSSSLTSASDLGEVCGLGHLDG